MALSIPRMMVSTFRRPSIQFARELVTFSIFQKSGIIALITVWGGSKLF